MSDTIFTKIINKEIPADILYEDDMALAFKDINPQAPIHIVIIPKKNFCSYRDFSKNASTDELVNLMRSIGQIAEKMSLDEGYRIICNTGENGGQEVPHVHFHLLGGKSLGWILP